MNLLIRSQPLYPIELQVPTFLGERTFNVIKV